MPFDLQYWAGIAALISGMVDVINLSVPLGQAVAKRSADPGTAIAARALQAALSTYSDEEVKAIERRLKSCRDRFVTEGSGGQRADCLCSVLRDVSDGNGGEIPVDDWEQAYKQLKCGSRAG